MLSILSGGIRIVKLPRRTQQASRIAPAAPGLGGVTAGLRDINGLQVWEYVSISNMRKDSVRKMLDLKMSLYDIAKELSIGLSEVYMLKDKIESEDKRVIEDAERGDDDEIPF